jgi:alpha-glucosidase
VPRHVSRLGDGSARDARLFAAFLLALPGPVILFQGEELGQPQARLELAQIQDPYDRMYWPEPMGRDGARAPMAWDDDRPRCGFSGARPWIPVQHPEDGAAVQQDRDPASVLNFYRTALRLRRELGLGEATMTVEESPEGTILARLDTEGGPVTLAVNMTEEVWPLPGGATEPILHSVAPDDAHSLPARSAAWLR